MAPRPSTPQGLPHGGSHGPRSLSAPNSPARPGMFQGINRLPSQDSLDRSIHNESGHGKSTAQIIRDLKHSNASLSAKQASQEAQFMNQLSEVTKSFEDQRVKMDADIRNLKKQLAHLEAYKAAADAKLKEKDASLSKVKEESAFQRHSISDLKNQLYQLQTDLEDAQQNEGRTLSRGSQEEMAQLLMDNQEMARELANLQAELRDSERARHELERSKGKGKPPAPPSNSGESPTTGYYQKFQETQSELERHRKRLSATQSRMEGLEAEKQSLELAHAKTVEELQEELVKQSELFQRRERDLMAQIESLEFTDSQVTVDLRREVEERDNTIGHMQDELEQYADQAAELAAQLAEAQQAAASQENYRRDEAEDLRILHDAQEEEISNLRKQLEEARKEVEIREEELEESNARLEKVVDSSSSKLDLTTGDYEDDELIRTRTELNDLKFKLEEAESELSNLRRMADGTVDSSDALQNELEKMKEHRADLEEELVKTRSEQERRVKELNESIDTLTKEKEEIWEKLASLDHQKNDAISMLESKNSEFSKLRSHWEGKAGKAQEAESLKSEIEIHKQRAHDASENERAATEKIYELGNQLRDLEKELEQQRKVADEANIKLQEKIAVEIKIKETEDATANSLLKAEAELNDLRKTISSYESGGNKTAKQLREAQIALVALDDEKKAMSQKHRELLMAVEKKKEEIQRLSHEKLAAKDQEILVLEKRLREAEALESEEIKKLRGKLTLSESQQANEIKKLRDELLKARSLEDEKTSLEKRVQSLESSSRAVPVSPEPNLAESKSIDTAAQAKLETKIRVLSGENNALRTKLKDRDTTIAALVRSSVSLENKISSMESDLQEVRSVQSEEKKMTEVELHELRKTLSALKDREPKVSEEVALLKRELNLAKQDGKRWRRALEERGGSGSDYQHKINRLHKELEESVQRLKERDQAIETLVNQSISQEAHVKDLKTRISSLMKQMEKVPSNDDSMLESEVERLKEETEMFAGQIIEQDEEIQNLRRRLHQRDDQLQLLKREVADLKERFGNVEMSTKQSEEVQRLKKDLSRVAVDLKARDEEVLHLQKRLEETRHQAAPAEIVSRLQAELDELQEARNDNHAELRDLRRQLWDAKQAAGEANDLKLELAQAKYALDEYKRTSGHGIDDTNKIEQLKLDLQARNARIAELESTSGSFNEEQVAVFRMEITSLRSELNIKTQTLGRLSDDIRLRDAALQKADHLKMKILGELTATKDELDKLKDEVLQNQKFIESFDIEKETLVKEKQQLLEEKESIANERDALMQEVSRIQNKMTELERVSGSCNEEQVGIFQKEIESLRSELSAKTETVGRLSDDIRSRDAALQNTEHVKMQILNELSDTKDSLDALKSEVSRSQRSIESSDIEKETLVKEKQQLLDEKEALAKERKELMQEVSGLQNQVESLGVMLNDRERLQAELEQSQKAIVNSEKSIVDSYEKRLSALTLDRDITIDQLRKDLAESRGKMSEESDEMARKLRSLQENNESLREQFDIELHAKNQQIYALEHTLHAQEQIVESMRAEMDQLQSGMERATEKRRGEIEDLQQELMQLEGRALKQEREITTLKMQLEEGKLEHKAEVVRLKESLASMEKESPLTKTMAALQNDDRMLEVRERLEQLKARNTTLQEENLKLGGRLERKVIEIKSLEYEKARAEELDKENESLRRQVKELGSILEAGTRSKASRSSSTRSPSTNDTSSTSQDLAPVSTGKENAAKGKDKAAKGKGLKGLFKRKGFSSDDVIQEE